MTINIRQVVNELCWIGQVEPDTVKCIEIRPMLLVIEGTRNLDGNHSNYIIEIPADTAEPHPNPGPSDAVRGESQRDAGGGHQGPQDG